MWPGQGWGFDWWVWLIGGSMMLLFWGGVIALAFFAVRAVLRSSRTDRETRSPEYQKEDPLEILKTRYARGEISREEYLDIRRDLEE